MADDKARIKIVKHAAILSHKPKRCSPLFGKKFVARSVKKHRILVYYLYKEVKT